MRIIKKTSVGFEPTFNWQFRPYDFSCRPFCPRPLDEPIFLIITCFLLCRYRRTFHSTSTRSLLLYWVLITYPSLLIHDFLWIIVYCMFNIIIKLQLNVKFTYLITSWQNFIHLVLFLADSLVACVPNQQIPFYRYLIKCQMSLLSISYSQQKT